MRPRWVSVTGVVLLATLAILTTLLAGIRVMGYQPLAMPVRQIRIVVYFVHAASARRMGDPS